MSHQTAAAARRRRRALFVEHLEERRVLATLYVDNPDDFVITNNVAPPELSTGDEVTWNPGPNQVGGLIYGTNAFGTISAAITAAAPSGDTVRVAQGTFNEDIIIGKSLTLLGAQSGVAATGSPRGGVGSETTLAGTGNSSSFVVTIQADEVIVDGLDIAMRDSARDGINVRTGSNPKPGAPTIGGYRANIQLRNNWIHRDAASTGQRNGIVFGEHVSNGNVAINGEIENVDITGNYVDLPTFNGASPNGRGLIFTNMFRDSGATIKFTDFTIDSNTVIASSIGMFASAAQGTFRFDNAGITNNLFKNTVTGVNVGSLHGSTFSGNTVENTSSTGALLGLINSTAEDNLFQKNTGFYALGLWGGGFGTTPSSNSALRDNTFVYNDVALVPGTTYSAGLVLRAGGTAGTEDLGTTGVAAGSITLEGNEFSNGGFSGAIPTAAVIQRSFGTTLNPINTSGDSAKDNKFDGIALTPATTLANLYAIADKVVDSIDVGNFGAVLLKTANRFVTPNSFFAPNGTSTPSIQRGIDAAVAADTVQVAAGTYTDNLSLNKSLTLLGAQADVDARGRVVGAPNPAVETVVAPGSGSVIDMLDPADGSIVNGFSFVGSVSGATGVLTTSNGPVNGLELRNNYVAVANGFTAAALWMNDSAINATFDQNEFVAATGSTYAVFFDSPDQFHGLYFTDNNVLRDGAAGGTGLYVDGNRNVGTSAGPGSRSPLVQGNLFQNHALGFNAGQRSFQDAQIVENTFTANSGGLAGGPKNSTITRNTFSSNSLYGLRLTSFGNTSDAARGAQNVQVTNNVFSGNGTTVDMVNGYGDIRIDDQFNGTQSTNTISGNSLGSAVGVFNREANLEVVNFSGNWWGTTANPESSGKVLGGAAGNVDYSPWLNSATDTNVGTPGFQGDFSVLSVDDDSAQSGVVPFIAEALAALTSGSPSQVIVFPGTYSEAVTIARGDLTSLTLKGQSGVAGDAIINAGGSNGVAITAPATVTLQDLRITNANQGLTATGLTALTLSNLLIDASTSGGTIGTTPSVTFAGSPGNDSIDFTATQLSNTGLQAIGHSGISTLNLNGLAGNDSIVLHLGGSLPGTINVDGGAHTTFDTLQIVGTSSNDALVVSGTVVTGGGPTVNLANLEKLSFDLSGNGADTLQIDAPVTQPSTSIAVTGGGTGSDTLTVNTGAAGVTIGIDADSIDVGGQQSVEYSNLDDIYVNSGDNADTYTVGPSPTATIHLDANSPTDGMGDVLNYVGPGGSATTIHDTYIQSTGYAPVYYQEFETINLGGELVVVGSGLNDVLDLTATGVASGSYVLTTDGTDGPTIGLSGVTKFTFDSLAGDDKLIIRNPAGSLFAPANGIEFFGGDDADDLEVLGGSGSSGSYTVGPASGEGTLTQVTGAGTQTIHFTGLEPVATTTTLTTFDIYVSSDPDTINVIDGDEVGGVQTLQVNFDFAYELIQFANKTTVTVHGGDGNDSFDVDFEIAPDGVSTLNLNGEGGADSFVVAAATPAGLNTNLSGDVGDDDFDVDFTLTGSVSGGADGDTLHGNVIDDAVLVSSSDNGFTGTEPSVTGGFSGINTMNGNGGTLTGMSVNSTWGLDGSPTYFNGTHTLDFTGFANLQGAGAIDTFNLLASSQFNLKGGDHNDQFVLSNGVTLTGSIDGNDGSDTLNYSAFTTPVCVDLSAGPPGSATNITGGILAGVGLDVGSSVENLYGGSNDDTLIGDIDANSIYGNGGDDLINAKANTDYVDGGLGDDVIRVAGTEAEFDGILGGPGGVGATGDYDQMVNDGVTTVTLNGFNQFFDVFTNSIDEYIGAGYGIVGNGGDNQLHFGFTKMTGVGVTGLDAGTSLDNVTTSYNNVSEVAYSGGGDIDHVTLVFTPDQLDAMLTADIVAVQDYLANPTGKTLTVTADDLKGNFTATQFETASIAVYDDSSIVTITSCFLAVFSELQIITGTSGNDSLNGTNLADLIFGEDGDDLIFGNDGSDCLFGGAGLDSLYGGNLDDLLVGGSSADLLYGGDDEDTLNGGLGDDSLYGEAGQDLLHGNDGDDTLDGGEDNDVLNGDAGTDTVAGGNGADTIQIFGDQAVDDRMDGGASSDTLEIIAAGGPATLIGFSNGVAGGGYSPEFSSNIEAIKGNNQSLQGTNGPNWFDLSTIQPFNLLYVDGLEGADYLNGSGFADDLRGGNGDDSIFGNGGFDVLSGGNDNDYLDGGLNDDILDGGDGLDTVLGGDGYDTIRVRTDEAEFDVMNGGANTDNVQNMAAAPVVLNGFAAATNSLEGWIGNNQPIWGNDSANVLNFIIVSPTTSMTLTGVTNIDGRGGNDTITGTNGADVIYGGLGDDVVNGMYGSDRLYGYGSDVATAGDTGNDILNGGDGVDYLYGGAGDDRIITGAGRDIVYYASSSSSEGNDQLDDFTTSDRINFAGTGWTLASITQVVAAPDLNINLPNSPNSKTIKVKNRTSALPSYVFLFV